MDLNSDINTAWSANSGIAFACAGVTLPGFAMPLLAR